MNKVCFFYGMIMALCGCSQKPASQMIKPLPSKYQITRLKNATVAASFSTKDFSWKDGKLSMDVYSEDLYDAAKVGKLKPGDTLVYSGQPIVAKNVIFKDSFVTVNGGIEEGGADLTAKHDSVYRGTQLDGHSTYTKLGKVKLPLAKNFQLIDCGVNPTDPYDTIKVAQADYLRKLHDYKRNFSPLDTRVLIKDGTIVSIKRIWIP